MAKPETWKRYWRSLRMRYYTPECVTFDLHYVFSAMAEMEAHETGMRKRGCKCLRYEHLWIQKKRKLQKDSGDQVE